MDKITVFDDFFPKELFEEFLSEYKEVPMKYGWKSSKKHDEHGHWNFNLAPGAGSRNLSDVSRFFDNMPIIKKMWEHVKPNIFGGNVVPIRCYINAHTYGVEGYFHKDSSRLDETTTVLYMNEEWYPNWAGETVFYNKEKNSLIRSVLPQGNRIVMFPSNIPHCARGVTRKCEDLRMTFMFKTRKTRSETFEKLSGFLTKNGATTKRHTEGSLHDHLMRVYQILETAGYPATVCLAGGLHSVYGTSSFKNPIFFEKDRQKIIEEYGEEVENLVTLFGYINRPKALENPIEITDTNVVVRNRNDDPHQLTRLVYDQLCAMECANLIDQNPSFEEKYPRLNAFWSQNDLLNK